MALKNVLGACFLLSINCTKPGTPPCAINANTKFINAPPKLPIEIPQTKRWKGIKNVLIEESILHVTGTFLEDEEEEEEEDIHVLSTTDTNWKTWKISSTSKADVGREQKV